MHVHEGTAAQSHPAVFRILPEEAQDCDPPKTSVQIRPQARIASCVPLHAFCHRITSSRYKCPARKAITSL